MDSDIDVFFGSFVAKIWDCFYIILMDLDQ